MGSVTRLGRGGGAAVLLTSVRGQGTFARLGGRGSRGRLAVAPACRRAWCFVVSPVRWRMKLLRSISASLNFRIALIIVSFELPDGHGFRAGSRAKSLVKKMKLAQLILAGDTGIDSFLLGRTIHSTERCIPIKHAALRFGALMLAVTTVSLGGPLPASAAATLHFLDQQIALEPLEIRFYRKLERNDDQSNAEVQ